MSSGVGFSLCASTRTLDNQSIACTAMMVRVSEWMRKQPNLIENRQNWKLEIGEPVYSIFLQSLLPCIQRYPIWIEQYVPRMLKLCSYVTKWDDLHMIATPMASLTSSSSHFQTAEWRFNQKSRAKSKIIIHHNPQLKAAYSSTVLGSSPSSHNGWNLITHRRWLWLSSYSGLHNGWLKGWRFKTRLQLLHMSEVSFVKLFGVVCGCYISAAYCGHFRNGGQLGIEFKNIMKSLFWFFATHL